MRDPEIRALFKNLELNSYYNDPNSKVIDEFDLSVAKARIDIAVLNGSMYGYEIKGASDTLNRLPSQIDAYTKVFDYISVITEEKYVAQIKELVPKCVGIYLCTEWRGKKNIKRVRAPKRNKLKVGFFIAKLMWREELIECLEFYKIPFRKKDRNWILSEILSEKLDTNTLSDYVRERLKSRENWKSNFTVYREQTLCDDFGLSQPMT